MYTLDVAPNIGIKLNKRIAVYGGYIWKLGIAENGRLTMKNTNIHGFRGALEINVYKGFMAVGVYERLKQFKFEEDGAERETNATGLLLWIGKKYKLAGNVYGQSQVFYNFKHDDSELYSRPFNIRFGFFFNNTGPGQKEKKQKTTKAKE